MTRLSKLKQPMLPSVFDFSMSYLVMQKSEGKGEHFNCVYSAKYCKFVYEV